MRIDVVGRFSRRLALAIAKRASDSKSFASHMLAVGTTLPNSLPIEEVVIWIRLLLQFCSDFGELGECVA
jgi:hypothetical protein